MQILRSIKTVNIPKNIRIGIIENVNQTEMLLCKVGGGEKRMGEKNQNFKKDLQEIFKFFEQTEPNLYLQKKIIKLQTELRQEIDALSDKDILFLNFFIMTMSYQRAQRQLVDPVLEILEGVLKQLPEQLKNMVKGLQAIQQVLEDLTLLAKKEKS